MLILERLRGDMAVISEGDKEYTVPRSKVTGCHEGDVIILSDGKYSADKNATEKRRQKILALQNSLWEE